MALSPTAARMLDTLPAYYWDEPTIERIIQAQANEIDRLDALVDQLKVELMPGAATDAHGLLAMWEITLGLPARPPDATESQRRAKIVAALRKLDSGSSADALATLAAAIGAGAFSVERDTPGLLQDTLQIPFEPGSYSAATIEALALKIWPAHRRLFMRYEGGFILDVSRLDADTL